MLPRELKENLLFEIHDHWHSAVVRYPQSIDINVMAQLYTVHLIISRPSRLIAGWLALKSAKSARQ